MFARLWVPALVLMPSSACADTAEQALARARAMLADPCRQAAPDEIVVCGSRSRGEAYRVPAQDADSDRLDGHARRGEVPNASPDRLSAKGCGIFEGERRCGKAEMLRYGYGGGRDPLSVLLKLGTILADPDADVVPVPAKRR